MTIPKVVTPLIIKFVPIPEVKVSPNPTWDQVDWIAVAVSAPDTFKPFVTLTFLDVIVSSVKCILLTAKRTPFGTRVDPIPTA